MTQSPTAGVRRDIREKAEIRRHELSGVEGVNGRELGEMMVRIRLGTEVREGLRDGVRVVVKAQVSHQRIPVVQLRADQHMILQLKGIDGQDRVGLLIGDRARATAELEDGLGLVGGGARGGDGGWGFRALVVVICRKGYFHFSKQNNKMEKKKKKKASLVEIQFLTFFFLPGNEEIVGN